MTMPTSTYWFARAGRALFWCRRWLLAAALVFSFIVPPAALAGEPGAAGDLYVSGFSSKNVVQFDGETGEFVCEFVPQQSGGLYNAAGMAFGPNGNLFVCNFTAFDSTDASAILEYDGQTGAFIQKAIAGENGTNPASGWLLYPDSLLFTPDGRLLVCGYSNGAVLAYDATTFEWLGTFAIGGPSPGGLHEPHGIALGPNGNLLVTSRVELVPEVLGNVSEFHFTTGAFLGMPVSGLDPSVRGLQVTPDGNCWVATYWGDSETHSTGKLLQLDLSTGEVVTTADVYKPRGLVLAPNGNVLVAHQSEVLEFDGSTGQLIGTFASSEQLSNAEGIVFKPAPPEPMPPPTISGVSVTGHDACDVLSGVTVTGTNLDADEAMVMLANPNEPLGTNGLVTTYVSLVVGSSGDGTSLTVDFDLDGGARMPGGPWDVLVVNPDGQMDTLAAAIDVAPCWVASEQNLFVLGSRHRNATRHGLFEYDSTSGDLIGFMVEDRSGTLGPSHDLEGSTGFALGHDGNLLFTSGVFTDHEVLQYDGITGRKIGTFIPAGTGGMLTPWKLTFGPNGNLFVLHRNDFCTASGVLEFDGLTGAFVRDFAALGSCGLFACGKDLEFSPDGLLLHVTDGVRPMDGPSGGVYVFDGQTGECISGEQLILPPGDSFRAYALEFSPHDGNLVLPWWSEPGLGLVTVHDPQTGDLLGTPIPPPAGDIQQAHASDFGPDGHLFVAGVFDYGVFEYDLIAEEVPGIFASQATTGDEIAFKPLQGDADGDWDLDLGDFARMQQCFGGEVVTPGDYNCFKLDQDRDGDVDLEDAAALTAAMTGPD